VVTLVTFLLQLQGLSDDPVLCDVQTVSAQNSEQIHELKEK
jgi:hypothetical protein